MMYAKHMSELGVDQAWIGVHDLFEETKFVTVLDEELADVGYANWTSVYGVQEPNNSNDQDCVCIVNRGGGMDDNWCGTKMSYICKINMMS